MAEKMAAVQGYSCISSVYVSYQEILLIAFHRMPSSMLGFLVFISVTSALSSVSYCLFHSLHLYGARLIYILPTNRKTYKDYRRTRTQGWAEGQTIRRTDGQTARLTDRAAGLTDGRTAT